MMIVSGVMLRIDTMLCGIRDLTRKAEMKVHRVSGQRRGKDASCWVGRTQN